MNATFIGMHNYDDRLPDFSELGTATTLADADALHMRLAALPTEPLSPSEELDRRLAEGFLLIQRWESQSAQFGWSNPTLFTGEAIFGVISLLLRPFAPLEERLSSASARLAAVPEFLTRHQLHAAPPAWIDRARRECTGARLLLEDVSIAWPRLEPAARDAAEAFARFDADLERVGKKLLPHATQDYACGAEAFTLLLRHAHFLEVHADALERRELELMAEEEAALSVAPPTGDTVRVGDYLARCTELWNAARELVGEHDFVCGSPTAIQMYCGPSFTPTMFRRSTAPATQCRR